MAATDVGPKAAATGAAGSAPVDATPPLRQILDAVPGILWTAGADGGLTYLNERWREVTGLEAAAGLAWGWIKALHPDDREPVEKAWRRALAAGEAYAQEHRLRLADGRWRWYLSRAEPQRSPEGAIAAWYGTMTDIHAKREAEAGRHRGDERFRNMADTAPVMLWLTDEKHRCILLSRGWTEFTGQGETDGLALGWLNAVHPDDRAQVARTFLDAAERREPVTLDYRLRRADGTYRWAVDSGRPHFDDAGTFRGYTGSVMDVHDHKEAEAALRESEARFRVIADNLPLIIWLHDHEGEQTFVNQTFCDYFDVTREEMQADRWRMLTHPGDGTHYIDEFMACVRERRPFHAEVRVQRRGEWRWLESWGRPRFDDDGTYLGHVGTSADVTDRKAAERALRDSEERLRLAAEAAEFGTYDRDLTNGVNVWSDRLKEMFGLGVDDPVPRDPVAAGLIHPDDVAQLLAAEQAALDPNGEGLFEIEHRLVRPDGIVRWVAARGRTIFGEKGRRRIPLRATGAVIDITARKETERALRNMNEALEQRVAERTTELERQNQRLRLLANQLTQAENRERQKIAQTLHDGLQQILIAAKVQLSLWADEQDGDSIGLLDTLLEEAVQTSRSLSYDLSPPILRSAELPEALAWLAERFEVNHHFEVELQVEDNFPILPEHLKVFLFNGTRELLLNAVKHSGSRRARARLYRPERREAALSISDDGDGFDARPVEEGEGALTGFGLFSIRERLTALGGRFEIDTAPGHGARFVLIIPLADAAAQQEPLAFEAAAVPLRRRHEGPLRVLVVDDHSIVREGLGSLLERENGIDLVGQAADGIEALARTRELEPDVVLMDVDMPRMNGIEATRQIKRDHPTVAVVALSFHEEQDMSEAMRRAGASAYVRKGSAPELLLAAIRGVFAG